MKYNVKENADFVVDSKYAPVIVVGDDDLDHPIVVASDDQEPG